MDDLLINGKPAEPVDDTKYSMQTHLIYGKNTTNKWDYAHHVVTPLSSSVIFRLDSVERGAEGFKEFAHTEEYKGVNPIYIYDRLGEPNKDMLEENLAYIERGERGVTFATGMGAISAVLGVLTRSGDEIITHKTLYGCTLSLLTNWYPKYNISTVKADLTFPDNIYGHITPQTRVVMFESPANPNLDIINISRVTEIISDINRRRSKEEKIYVVVDNTFATPYCQRPLELGADFVVHSLTKGIGGFGTDMGGAVIGPAKFHDALLMYRKDFGAVLGTKAAWTVLTYGLPTLHVRVTKQIENAKKAAEFLSKHSKVEFVNYPGLSSYSGYETAFDQMKDFEGNFTPGGMLYFALKGRNEEEQKEKGRKFMNYAAEKAYTMTLAVSLGMIRTLIEHPATMTHSVIPAEELKDYGIHPGGIRMSMGLENSDDIIMDLEKCLQQV